MDLIDAVKENDYEKVSSLIEYFYEIPYQYVKKSLIIASRKGHAEIVTLLINYRINKPIDEAIDKALIEASSEGHYDVAKILIARGADPARKNSEALRWAAHNRDLKMVKLLSPLSDLNAGKDQEKILIDPVRKGYIEIVEFLIKNGANIFINGYSVLPDSIFYQ